MKNKRSEIVRIMADSEHDFDMLVTQGKLRVISLQEIVDRIKIHAEQTKSQELKTAVNQIEEKVDSILKMFFDIPKSESLEFTQLFCFQLRKMFRWKTVQWKYATEDQVPIQSKEMSYQAQILANLYGSKVRLIHIIGKSVGDEFKADEKCYKILGVYNPTVL